jgi:hypothetical protein
VVFIDDLLVNDTNEAKMAAHGVGVTEALEVLEVDRYEVFHNRAAAEGGAPYVIVGQTRSGRLLTIPVDPTPLDGLWRPRSAYDSGRQQALAYGRHRQGK